METEGIIWLKRIKDGSILNYLKEIHEIETNIPEKSKRLLYEIINSNKKGIFPRVKELEKSLNFCGSRFYEHKTYLKNKNLIFDFTVPELLYVFKIYTPLVSLPHQLDLATHNEIKKFRRAAHKGGSKSWEERLQTPRAPYYCLFYIALISENKRPVFSKSFSFLKIYNPFS